MSNQVEDRRSHPRIPATVKVEGTHAEQGIVARMVTSNLSLGGLYCTSTTDFPEMSRLAVGLTLPDSDNGSEPLNLDAVVVRRLPAAPSLDGQPRYELALFFTNVDDDARRRLASFLGS